MNKEKIVTALQWILAIFNKHNISYQIAGGFAAHLYGATRHVNDIDFDIPEEDFDEIYEDVKEFIIYGPERFKNKKWNLFLMTLEYHGQKIDIGGAESTKIFDDHTQKWVKSPTHFSNSRIIRFHDIPLLIIDPTDLKEYKKLLIDKDNLHQEHDVKAIELFLAAERNS